MEVQYEATINGKQVKFRQRIPAREGGILRKHLADTASDNYWDDLPALKLVVEPCELVPHPEDDACWGELDTLSEFIPLCGAVAGYIFSRIAAAQEIRKN
jgi:hypothetical protein